MRRPQLTVRALLVAMLAVAAFFAGAHFERRRKATRYEEVIDALEAENAALRNPFNAALRNPFRLHGSSRPPRGSSAATQSWLQGYAEAVEARGFEGLTPIRD